MSMQNTGMAPGQVAEVKRAVLPHAQRIVVAGTIDASTSEIMGALQGIPVTVGDTLVVDPSYLTDRDEPLTFEVVAMKPAKPATIGVATVLVEADPETDDEPAPRYSRPNPRRQAPPRNATDRKPAKPAPPSEPGFGAAPQEIGPPDEPEANEPEKPTGPTQQEALLAGLNDQLDLLTGWLSLLTKPGNLPTAWGLPQVAG